MILLVSSLGANVAVLSNLIHYTHRGDPGQDDWPGNWDKCIHRAGRWIRPPRPPGCGDAAKNMGRYYHGAGT